MRLRIIRLRIAGMQIGRRCWLRRIRVPRNPWDVVIGDEVALDDDVVLLTTGSRTADPRVLIGSGTYVNRFTMFDASERVEVGRNCLIGPFCYITDHDHAHLEGPLIRDQILRAAPVSVGDDVWIGAGVVILKGVCVGQGAIVGAGSVVTRSVAPHTKVAGTPARVIGAREAASTKGDETRTNSAVQNSLPPEPSVISSS
jgi:maltose O-acetyltransferase